MHLGEFRTGTGTSDKEYMIFTLKLIFWVLRWFFTLLFMLGILVLLISLDAPTWLLVSVFLIFLLFIVLSIIGRILLILTSES